MNEGIKVWKIQEHAIIPARMTQGSVGYDICSIGNYFIQKGEFVLIKTGIVVKPPPGFHIEIALRSSMPNKKGLAIPNGVGIIDQDYCGSDDELGIPVYKFGNGTKDYTWPFSHNVKYGAHIEKGERVAQLILRPTQTPAVINCTGTPFSAPNRGGFGSTGDK